MTRRFQGFDTTSPTYRSWISMRSRCNNPNTPNWHNYGERGVTYDPRWNSFAVFIEEMGERPEGTSLDKDSKGGKGCLLYCKENCCWASQSTQSRNRRNTRLTEEDVLEIRKLYSEGKRIYELRDMYGVSKGCIVGVVKRHTWKDI